MGGSLGKSKSSSSTTQLSPDQIQKYFDKVDSNTGGGLSDFAKTGTQAIKFDALTGDDIQKLGGMGATRMNTLNKARNDVLQGIEGDSALTLDQRLRANQLTTDSFTSDADAIAKETEAAIAQLMDQQNRLGLDVQQKNNARRREDLEAIANIYFGGKGSNSSGSSKSISASASFGGGDGG